MWDLSSPTGDRTHTPCAGRWMGCEYWMARKVPLPWVLIEYFRWSYFLSFLSIVVVLHFFFFFYLSSCPRVCSVYLQLIQAHFYLFFFQSEPTLIEWWNLNFCDRHKKIHILCLLLCSMSEYGFHLKKTKVLNLTLKDTIF